ncbi:unnamed protein product [Gongylonema pulchrum]|uniref:Molybdopterin synthase catalytic subunit n=1 Tax=Gongylonema pulchrum TaxID=637853 RepID=A0A183DST1_9BILA|nr:unnamed protein product [Gongylonema pulchrum]
MINIDNFLSTLEKAIAQNDFVIIEGNMILQIESLQKLIHRAVFVTLRRGICEERRATRNYNPPDLPGYVDEVVWPAYKSHLACAQKLARRSALIAFTDGNVQNFLNESEVKESFFPFSGTVRDNCDDKQVVCLEYESYDEMAYKELDRLCTELRKYYPEIDRIAIFHRVGSVPVAETSVIVAVSAPHRHSAIRATEQAIDYLKKRVPLWKKVDFFCLKVISVPVAETSVIVAVSAPHRHSAIRATEQAIDYLKKRVPLWKKVDFFLFKSYVFLFRICNLAYFTLKKIKKKV